MTLSEAPIIEAEPVDALVALREKLASDQYSGGPRAIMMLDLLAELSDPKTVSAVHSTLGKKPRIGVTGTHLIPETGKKVTLKMWEGGDDFLDHNRPVQFYAQFGSRRLGVSMEWGSILKHTAEHIVNVVEKKEEVSGGANSKATEDFFTLLRRRLYGDEVAEIINKEAGVSGDVMLDAFNRYCPCPLVRFTEEPKIKTEEWEDYMGNERSESKYVGGTSNITSFSLAGRKQLDDGLQVALGLSTINYESPGNSGFIEHVEKIKLEANYAVAGKDADSVSTGIVIIGDMRWNDNDRKGYVALEHTSQGKDNIATGRFIGSPIPHSVTDFFSQYTGEIEAARMQRFAKMTK